MKYRLTEEALIALDEIAHFIALDNEKAAMRVTDRVLETCKFLCDMPHLGRHPEFATDPELLCYPTKQYPHYLIFYRVEKNAVVIADVVHGARDLPALFGEK